MVRSKGPREYKGRPGEQEVEFMKGDFVLKSVQGAHGRPSKLQPKWVGPLLVLTDAVDDSGGLVFELLDVVTGKREKAHARYLKRFCARGCRMTKQLKETAGYIGWGQVVEDVVGHRYGSDGQVQFEVRWKNDGQSTWEPFGVLCESAGKLLRRYVRGIRDEGVRQKLLALF